MTLMRRDHAGSLHINEIRFITPCAMSGNISASERRRAGRGATSAPLARNFVAVLFRPDMHRPEDILESHAQRRQSVFDERRYLPVVPALNQAVFFQLTQLLRQGTVLDAGQFPLKLVEPLGAFAPCWARRQEGRLVGE